MTESKYYTPPSIVCDKAFIEELKKKEIEFITTNLPYNENKERSEHTQ